MHILCTPVVFTLRPPHLLVHFQPCPHRSDNPVLPLRSSLPPNWQSPNTSQRPIRPCPHPRPEEALGSQSPVGHLLTRQGSLFLFFSPPPRMLSLDLRERRGREGERETLMWVSTANQMPPLHAPTGDGTRNLGMCPDRGSNPRTFGVRDNPPTHGAAQPEQRPQF